MTGQINKSRLTFDFLIMYKFLRILVGSALRIWFRKIYVSGRQHIPENGPVILACNHPNTFLDGMVAAKFQPHTVYMLARGDAFRRKLTGKLLRMLYLLPIYRLKEGAEYLSKNDESFKECFEILKKKGTVLIFSEGISLQNWQLMPLKKGTARIAFGAEVYANHNLGMKVVPVGINYTSFTRPGNLMLLNYGTPVCIEDYTELYSRNPAKAYLAFNEELQKKLSKLVLAMPDALEKSLQKILLHIHLNEFDEPKGWLVENDLLFEREKKFTKHLTEKIQEDNLKPQLTKLLSEYSAELRAARITDAALAPKRKTWGGFILFLLLPMWLCGWLLHLAPMKLAQWLPKKILQNNDFRPSLWFSLGMVLVPFYYLLLLILVLIVQQWWMLLLIPLLPFLGYFANRYALQSKIYLQKQRLKTIQKRHPKKFTKLAELRKGILELTG